MSARNVFNVAAVDKLITEIAATTDNPKIERWLQRAARRWVFRHYESHDRVVRDPATGALVLVDPADPLALPQPLDAAPAWLGCALEAGQPVVRLRLDAGLAKRLRRAVAYLEWADRRAALRDPIAYNFPDVETLVAEWRRQNYRDRIRPVLSGETRVFRYHDQRIVQLRTATALRREGRRMQHCVAEYGWDVRYGRCEIYSLRDECGQPRATIEVRPDGAVRQIKGPLNAVVAPDYRPPLRAFFRKRGYRVTDDQESIAYVSNLDRVSVKEFDAALDSTAFRDALRGAQYADATISADEREATMLRLWQIVGALPVESRRLVFHLLLPAVEAQIRVRRVRHYAAYDRVVSVAQVEAPLPLLNLVSGGVFDGLPEAVRGRRLVARTQDTLACLALDETRLYDLGQPPRKIRNRAVAWPNPSDLFARGSLEMRPMRARRHDALRQALNRSKVRLAGRRAAPDAGHVALRRLLDGSADTYVV